MESLFDLIQSLEPGLTDVKISSQRESIETLISGLKNIPISSITCKEIDHLVDFLSDRLAIADPNITNLILDGFIWLTKSVGSNGCSMISAEQAERIVQHGIFGHLSIQSLTKSGRLKVFQLLHCFLTGSQLVGIQSMKSTFVRNYLVAIDGEKDPQILQLIFHMNVLVINNFPSVDEFKDEIFETTSIYFPIDFSPPPGGGVAGITRDMLVSGLHQCLFAMRNMTGHNLMPLICEKIESDWSDGQLDALRLLTDCLHGRLLHVTNHDNNHMLSDGNPIDIRHISPYLAVIIPALITIANKMGKRRNKTDLYPLVLSCISGLVYAYSKQTSEKFQLEDFALILLRSFGLSFTDTNNCQSPVLIPSSTIVAYITESFKSAQNNILLSSILFSYIIPRVCVPLLSDSCLIFQHLVPKEDIKDHLEELLNWQPCISLLNKIFLCVTEDHLISALHYDKHIMKTLKVVKQNASIIIPQLREYIMTTPSLSEIFSERILHFSICTCRLSYSIIKYSAMMPCIPATNNSFDSSSSPRILSSSSEIDSIFNMVCTTIQWVNQSSSMNNNTLLADESSVSVRDELLSFIPVMYSSCDLFVNKLDDFLFDCLKNCQVKQLTPNSSDVSSDNFVMEVLKYCSFRSILLLKKVIEFILEKYNFGDNDKDIGISMDSDNLANVSQYYWVNTFTSLLCFICEKLTQDILDYKERLTVVSYLFNLCQDVKQFAKFSSHCYDDNLQDSLWVDKINKLHFILRIITSQSNSSEQLLLFHMYKDYFDKDNRNDTYHVNMGLFTVICGIICGLKPDVIKFENPVHLLTFIMNYVQKNLFLSSSSLFCCSNSLLSIFAQTYASVLNKSDASFLMDIKKHLSSSLNHLWLMIDENSSDLLDIFISFWILWSIRGMLSSYTTDNNEHVHHKELSDYLIQSMILKFTFSDTADEISSFQKALSSPGRLQCSISCFKQANCILLDSLSSTSSLNTFSHCNVTDLYIQNILTHVIEPIHDHLDLLINHIRSQKVDLENNNSFASFRDSMLMLYLNMTVHLPSEFLTDQLLSKVIPFALFAVTSSSNIRTQLAGLHFISIINKNPMRNLELCNLISDNQAEDLFGRLPKLIEASKSDEEVTNYDRKNVLNTLTFIRLTIAQCLLSLIKLPLQIINRHRDITILPLLDQLVDDPNRFVRIEAVRARNLWLI